MEKYSFSQWNTQYASARKRSAKKPFEFDDENRMANDEIMTNFE
jgi:hypothetical protein